MNWLLSLLNSSLGKKLLMALTGLFLSVFLVVHLIGNLQLLYHDGGYSFNVYAVFMTGNPLIKTISYGLYAIIVLHAVKGLMLAFQNLKARKTRYAVAPGNSTSNWTSRWMGVLGTIILAFIVIHMINFWYQYKFSEVPYAQYTTEFASGDTKMVPIAESEVQPMVKSEKMQRVVTEEKEVLTIKDLNREVELAFKNPLLVAFYVLCMLAIAFHLWHGFQSAFQTLGANHPKYTPLIKSVGIIFSIVIPAAFALIPVYVFFIK